MTNKNKPEIDRQVKLILASASARRHKLLMQAGIPHIVRPTDVTEINWIKKPLETAQKNARDKLLSAKDTFPDNPVVAADTVVTLNGNCIGKPENMQTARKMLRLLSGKTHQVITALAMLWPEEPARFEYAVSTVTFSVLSDETINLYFKHVNPLDKAGGYDIGDNGDILVESYQGSWSNIIGLPMEILTEWWQAHV